MIVDSHMHVWSVNDVDYYDDKTIYQYMAENNIDKTAITAISEKENVEMKRVVQAEPDKFFGIGYVNVRDMYPSLKRLEDGVREGYIRGIKLYPYAEHFMLDDDAINPVYETCLALDIPVLLHVGFQRSSLVHPSQVGAAPCKCCPLGFPVQFCTVLEKYPKLKLIMAHMGGDTYFQCLSICMRFENAYLDTAWLQYYAENQFPQVQVKDWIEHACKYLGSDRVLYGGEGTLPRDILQCDISDEEKENILWNNAAKLYKL